MKTMMTMGQSIKLTVICSLIFVFVTTFILTSVIDMNKGGEIVSITKGDNNTENYHFNIGYLFLRDVITKKAVVNLPKGSYEVGDSIKFQPSK